MHPHGCKSEGPRAREPGVLLRFIYFNLFIQKSKLEQEMERKVPSISSFPKWQQHLEQDQSQTRAGPSQSQGLETVSKSPTWVQGPIFHCFLGPSAGNGIRMEQLGHESVAIRRANLSAMLQHQPQARRLSVQRRGVHPSSRKQTFLSPLDCALRVPRWLDGAGQHQNRYFPHSPRRFMCRFLLEHTQRQTPKQHLTWFLDITLYHRVDT